MEDDVPEDTLSVRGDIRVMLSSLPMFGELSAPALEAIAANMEWLGLPGGATLFEPGEPPDAMYVVISGCLASLAAQGRDRRRLVSRLGAGETVGETGLISGRPRTVRVVALRDSELGRLSREAFDQLTNVHPEIMLRIAQLTVQRFEAAQRGSRGRLHGPRSFTLVPHGLDVDVAGFAIELVAALRRLGSTELVWSVRGADHTSHWFHKIESRNDYVVYVADHEPTTWSKLCVRQADALLLLARGDAEVGLWPVLADQRAAKTASQRAEIVLLHDEAIVPGAATRWLAASPGTPLHHVCGPADVQRVARLLTGTSVGLVLSGGGARGFAHIGVVKALREAGVPIDLVGGTSIGSIMGAATAMGWSIERMIEAFHRTFVASNPLGDFTLPVIALVSGRRVSERLKREFGDVAIEDLPIPFFCVSSNLTTGRTKVHNSGLLWHWLRAAVAIPGVLPPVMSGGEVFVDGATMNNLPVDVMRELSPGTIVAVDIGSDPDFKPNTDASDIPQWWRAGRWLEIWRRRPNLFQILLRSGMVSSSAVTQMHRDQADLLLQPPLEKVDMLRWRSFDDAIAAGYAHVVERLKQLPPPLAARLHMMPRPAQQS